MKECTGCHKPKPLTAFTRQAGCRDGLKYECRQCAKARQQQCRAARLDHYRRVNNEWNKRNRQRCTAVRRAWDARRRQSARDKAVEAAAA